MTNQRLYLAISIPILFNFLFLLFFLVPDTGARVRMVNDKVDASWLEVISRLVSRIERIADSTATFYRECGKQEVAIDKLQSNES